MVNAQIEQRIKTSLNTMPETEQERVAEFAESIATGIGPGVSGKSLRRFAGTLDDESAAEMIAAIEEGCEQVDLREWQD